MRPRDQTDARPPVEAVLVVVPARDEAEEITACLLSVAAAAVVLDLPVAVVVVLHRCTDSTGAAVEAVAADHPRVTWRTVSSDESTLGQARRSGVAEGRALWPRTPPGRVWLASTDADSQVPEHWLTDQVRLADSGLDLVLGTVVPAPDGSEASRLWHVQHVLAEGHTAIHGANLGVRLSAYDAAGGFGEQHVGEDADLVHRVRDRARLPWTSTDRTRVVTSTRRQGRVEEGFARFLRRLDAVVEEHGSGAALEARLRAQILRLARERGPERSLCPAEAAAVVDPARRQALTHLARAVACTLADEGLVVITQHEVPVDGRTTPGPVRISVLP